MIVSEGERIQVGDVAGWIRTERDAPFNIVEFTLSPGAGRSPRHVHDRIYEVNYILEGEVEARIGEDTGMLKAGDLVPIRPGTPHALRALETPARFLAVHCPGPDAWMLFERLGRVLRDRPSPAELGQYLSGLDIRYVPEPGVSGNAVGERE